MKVVPADKFDFQACKRLASATDAELEPFVSELLEWLQDLNWPVAPLVQKRLATMGKALVEPIRAVLNGKDDIWKYWIVISLLPSTETEVLKAVRNELQRIASHPTQGEKDEEVDLAAQQLLISRQDSV